MSATLRIIRKKVGDGGVNRSSDVRRIQQLLLLAGEKLPKYGADGDWGGESRDALLNFQKTCYVTQFTMPVRPWVEPGDKTLLGLLDASSALIALNRWKGGRAGFLDLHKRMESSVPFSWDHACWGLDGYPEYAVTTTWTKKNGRIRHSVTSSPHLNCSTYANLMMAIWRQGDCHRAPYDASVSQAGRLRFANWRYGYPLLYASRNGRQRSIFKSPDEVEAVLKDKPSGLFCIEKVNSGGVITHLALLLDGIVYECNYPKKVGVQQHPLRRWWTYRDVPGIKLSGPAPTG